MKLSVLFDYIHQILDRIPGLAATAHTLKSTLHQWILAGGTPFRRVADFLHGVWLGHPLHPILTDLTIGSWLLGTSFDILSLFTRSKRHQETADTLTKIGTISAVPTAIAGMTDYSSIKKEAASFGLIHAAINSVGLVLYVLSLRARSKGERGQGVGLSLIAFSGLTFSAWLGGELVYRFRVGVNHAPTTPEPESWTAVLPADSLGVGQSKRVMVNDQAILVYREDGGVYAIGAVCSHAGGPLEQGTFKGECVQCPWHDSVFNLRDGSVVHGPSTYRQPTYQVRVIRSQIEIRVTPEQQLHG